MKKAARIVASLILAGAMASVAMAGFEYHGYGRAGVLLNSKGGESLRDEGGFAPSDNGTFVLGGPAQPFLYNIGRLGNENNNYYEGVLTNTTKAGSVNASTTVRIANKDTDYSAYPAGASKGVFVRELYSEISNLPFAPKATVWAGKRFYGRDDIHINDFYWRVMDGTGAGIQNIEAGPGVIDLAFICASKQNDGNFPETEKGRNVQKNIDFRYRGVKALGGTIEGEVAVASSTKATGAGNADSGLQLAGAYGRSDFFGLTSGSTKVAVQYGTGLGANLGDTAGTWMNEDAVAMRALAWGVADVSDKLKVSPSFVFQNVKDLYGKSNPGSTSFMALTVRPQYNFTRNLALVGELGYGSAKQWSKKTATLTKLTIAPTITLDDTSFWTRPQLRAFVTYAMWDKDKIGMYDDAFDGKDNGTTYGVQMETWF